MSEILGVCPTCYLVVKESDRYISETGSSGTIAYHLDCEPKRMKFMRQQAPAWKEQGAECKKIREEWSYTIAELAEYLHVSESKLRKFESGKPVTHARLLGMAYFTFFRTVELELKLSKAKSKGV